MRNGLNEPGEDFIGTRVLSTTSVPRKAIPTRNLFTI